MSDMSDAWAAYERMLLSPDFGKMRGVMTGTGQFIAENRNHYATEPSDNPRTDTPKQDDTASRS